MAASATATESESAGSVLVVADSSEELWSQLPASLRTELAPDGNLPDVEILNALCLDSNDRREFLYDYASDADDLAWLCMVLGSLQARVAGRAKLRQNRRAGLDPAIQYLEVYRRKRALCAAAPDTVQWLVSLSGAHRSSRHLSIPKSRSAGSRAELEDKALARWRAKLAAILIDGKVPALVEAIDVAQAERLALRLSGSTRANTLKKHVQLWWRFTKWLRAAYGATWPSSVSMVVDFVDDLAAQPCGVTVPQAFASTLTFMERTADIPEAERLSPVSLCSGNLLTRSLCSWKVARILQRRRFPIPCC